MKFGLSARGLSYQSGGAKEYIKALAKTLPAIDPENEYYIYYSDVSQRLNLNLPNAHEVVLQKTPLIVWDHIILPWRLRQDGIEVMLYPKCVLPLIYCGSSVVTILDLGYYYPELNAYRPLDTLYMKCMIPRSVKRAAGILAISNSTRREILSLFKDVNEDKIHVTYLSAADSHQSSDEPIIDLSAGPYIFISSSLSPRKNIERCMQALSLVCDKIPHKIVITGGKAWGSSNAAKIAKELGLSDRFIVLGHVSEMQRSWLYRNADFYLMPSLYEGFSMTLLEAMQEGCPVAASNVTSHPEVVGDAAVMFDPYSVEDIAQAILRLATDTDLRSRLREEGPVQAAKFSWEKCARETAAVLHKVAASS